MLLLFLLRGSLPLAPAAPRAAVAGNEGESLQPSGDDAEQSTAAEDDERAVGGSVAVAFRAAPFPLWLGRRPRWWGGRAAQAPSLQPVQPGLGATTAGATAATARLCLRCWLDMRNLHPSFTATVSRRRHSCPCCPPRRPASPAYLGAYASFLEMLAGLTDANPLSRLAAEETHVITLFSA